MDKKKFNPKVAIIDRDGQVYMVGRENEARLHVPYLLKLLHFKYPNIEVGSVANSNARDRLAYILVELGNVVYLNDVSFGMVYFPKELTDKQLKTIDILDLDKKVLVCHSPREMGGNINFRNFGLDGDYNLQEATLEYLENTKIHERRK